MAVSDHELIARFPTSEEIVHPRVDTILWMMGRRYEDAWGYSPMALLTWRKLGSQEVRFQLSIMKHRRLGWFCEHADYTKGKHPRRTVLFNDGGDENRWAECWHHGGRAFFLIDCFVSRATINEVVTRFMHDGRKAKLANWNTKVQAYLFEDPTKSDESANVSWLRK